MLIQTVFFLYLYLINIKPNKMKKLILILAIFFISCSTDEIEQEEQGNQTCYTILSRGYDTRGNFIIVKISNYNNKRYKVDNYQDYLGVNEICDFTNLIEQPL